MRKLSKLLLLMLCASVFFISCEEEKFEPARLLVANAVVTPPVSPSPLPTIGTPFDVRWGGDLVLNNIVYGAASLTGGTPFTANNLSQTIAANYATVKSGAFPLNFSASAGATNQAAVGTTLYNRITSFLPGRSYTAIAFDVAPFYKTVVMEDDLSAPPSGKAKVRFVHALPAALLTSLPKRDTIDVTFTGGPVSSPISNTSIFSRRWFADSYTNTNNIQFAVIDTGRYTINYRVSGTPGTSPLTGLLGSYSNIRLENGKIYTILGRFHITTTAAPVFGATFITHN